MKIGGIDVLPFCRIPGLKPALGIKPPPTPKPTLAELEKKAAVTAPVIPEVVYYGNARAKSPSAGIVGSVPTAGASTTSSQPSQLKGKKGMRVKRRGYHVLARQQERSRYGCL